MIHTSRAIGAFPAFCAIILAVGLMNHVLVIPPLLEVARRDAWLTILVIALPYLLWSFLIHYIMKRTRQVSIIAWFSQHYGAVAAWTVRIFFILYLFMIAAVTLKETTTWTKVSYLNRTPVLILALTLILVCLMTARWGMRAITIGSGILLPFVIVFGDFVMTANLPKKDYTLMLPILENGWNPIWQGAVYIGGGLVELSIILLFQHHLKSRIRLWWMLVLALFLIALVFGPVTGAIAEFGPFEAADLRYPAYEEWRLVSIGKYIQHVDFLSIYQWLSGAVIRIAIAIYLIVDLIPLQSQRARNYWLLGLSAVLSILSALPISDMMYLDFMKLVYFPVSLLSIVLLSMILLILVLLANRRPIPDEERVAP